MEDLLTSDRQNSQRITKAFCVGQAKSGTASLYALLSRCYRAAHEPERAQLNYSVRKPCFLFGRIFSTLLVFIQQFPSACRQRKRYADISLA